VTLREDRGGALVTPTSDTECSVSAGKTLLFKNQPGASAMAAAALMSKEVAGELAEIVCYDVKP